MVLVFIPFVQVLGCRRLFVVEISLSRWRMTGLWQRRTEGLCRVKRGYPQFGTKRQSLMERTNGFEVRAKLRMYGPGRNTRRVVLSTVAVQYRVAAERCRMERENWRQQLHSWRHISQKTGVTPNGTSRLNMSKGREPGGEGPVPVETTPERSTTEQAGLLEAQKHGTKSTRRLRHKRWQSTSKQQTCWKGKKKSSCRWRRRCGRRAQRFKACEANVGQWRRRCGRRGPRFKACEVNNGHVKHRLKNFGAETLLCNKLLCVDAQMQDNTQKSRGGGVGYAGFFWTTSRA